MPTPITPSVGRKVWFFGSNQQREPWDATVIKVHADPDAATPNTPVNLSILYPDNGHAMFREKVVFHDAPEEWNGPHYQWMPYQAAQAAKAQAPSNDGKPDPSIVNETKVYTDGSSATGPAPLPDLSPAQQDAAAVSAGTTGTAVID